MFIELLSKWFSTIQAIRACLQVGFIFCPHFQLELICSGLVIEFEFAVHLGCSMVLASELGPIWALSLFFWPLH